MDKHRFLARFMAVFTTREDGRNWPLWRSMWRVADAYYQGLFRLRNEKYMYGIAVRIGLNNEQLESLVREKPWDYEALYDHLAENIPDNIRSPKATLVVDDFEGRTWRAWYHRVTMVLLGYAFLSMLRAREPKGLLPSLCSTVIALVQEMLTQMLMEKNGFERSVAYAVAKDVIQGFTDWSSQQESSR